MGGRGGAGGPRGCASRSYAIPAGQAGPRDAGHPLRPRCSFGRRERLSVEPVIDQSVAPPAEVGAAGDPLVGAWERLDEQIAWYDRRSAHGKRWYQRLKVAQIVIAAAIPVTAAAGAPAAGAPAVVAGAMGALIVVLESLQQLFQYQQNWTAYGSTCEALRHEKFLYVARAGPYADAARPMALLAERVEGLVSQEHAAWVSEQREQGAKGKG